MPTMPRCETNAGKKRYCPGYLTDNVLFGEDLGEFAGNQALLDLPKWLTDGYVAYLAENWSTDLDDELKSEMLERRL